MFSIHPTNILRTIRKPGSLAVIALTVLLLALPLFAAADAPLTQSYTLTGTYGLSVGGIGISETGSGDILLEVPGTPVRAFLYWALHDSETGGDDTLTLSVNGRPDVTITADSTYGPDYWFGANLERFHFVYSADVTAHILLGSNRYSISGVGPVILAYGAGLQVVYEDSALPPSTVEIIEGLDSGHIRFDPPRGPNTEVSCVTFSPAATSRRLDFALFVGGIDVSGDLRPDALWYQTGSGPTPSNLVNQPGAMEIGDQPFNSKDGPEWDTYRNTIPFPAGATYACFQIESVGDNPDLLGASMLWLALAASLPNELPTPSPTIPPTDTPLPTPTDTPLPTATNTGPPDPTDTPSPSPTSTSTPPSTNTPSPTDPATQTSTETPLIPLTGFSPGRESLVPQQPEKHAYRTYSDMNLKIPELRVNLPIVGIPLAEAEWDVTWLWREAGYLQGTAFPTWRGNTVITSHVFLSDGTPGPFANLDQLGWGDVVTIEAFGRDYTYQVRRTMYVRPYDQSVLGHEEQDWITLITCSGYDPESGTYEWRFAVQAVLVKIN